MKKFTRIGLPILVFSALIGYIGFQFAIENILPYSPIRPMRNVLRNQNPSRFTSNWQEFDITVEDSIKLKGWFIKTDLQPAKGTVFLLHGIANCRGSMLPLAKVLSENGYNSILFDFRAHGESSGLNCTFGYYEKNDISSYIDSAIIRYPNSAPYGILGHSLGAAISLQALAHDKRLVCGIVESPFTKLRTIVHDYFARIAFIRLDCIPDKALLYTEKIANFKIDSVQPILSARQINQPVMVVHGMLDKHISVTYGKEIYDSLKSSEKEWYPIANGEHNNLPQVGGNELNQRIITFFNKHLVKAN